MSGFSGIESVTDYDQLWVKADAGRIYQMRPTRDRPDGRREMLNGVTNMLVLMLPIIHTEVTGLIFLGH